MGVYIPNMEKPKTCEDCPCAYFTEGAYTDECQVTHNHITDEKPTDCPLIEISTPHGRLIDADELRAILRRWTEDEWNQKASPVSWAYAYEDVIDLIDDAPTILEAEE